MADPTVMIGVGATKAGTSWLHRYLSDHPDCHFRAIKELHFFNSESDESRAANRARIAGIRDRIAGDIEGELSPRQLANKIRNLAQVEHYLEVLDHGTGETADYLGYLLDDAGDAKIVGELTPAYGLLDEGKISQIANIAPDVRIIYLMRDPIERLWSHVRMIAKQRSKAAAEFPDRAANILSRVFGGKEEQIARRSDYAGPLARLNAAVDPKRLFIGVFEDIINGNLVDKICDFLGIAYRQPNLATVVNQGAPLPMNATQRDAAAAWLLPQYRAVETHFGALPRAWDQRFARTS